MTSDILKRAAEAVEGVTPGPWSWCEIDPSDPDWSACEVESESDYVSTFVCGTDNARFIAAARTLIPDMAAAIAERDAENARLTARAEAAEALLAAATGMVSIVEGMDGVMNHGVWRDDRGMRLKDTPEWVSLYNAHAAMREGR